MASKRRPAIGIVPASAHGLVYSDDVRIVQDALLRLGYSGVGDADGYLGRKTQAAILDFRNRSGLPLVSGLDPGLMVAIAGAPRKELPSLQLAATEKQIGTKVGAMSRNLWTRFWAKLAAIPSAILAVLAGVVGNFGDAINTLAPLKSFLSDWLQGVDKLTLVMGAAGLVTLVSGVLWASSRSTGAALSDGYKVGTVRNDLPEEAQAK